jgi:hypothetical protein
VSDPRNTGRGWIGVDLDHTLAEGTQHKDPGQIGDPIPLMVERVKRWLKDGKDVRIFTARDHKSYPAIRRWCFKHLGTTLRITNTKDRFMERMYDDRAVQVEPDTGKLL